MSEAAWLRSYAVERDAEAFAQIVSRYEGMVFATCRRRLHDMADVEDAVQETFLRLARKAGELRTNVGGWLHSCAVNVATDLNRRRASRVRREAAAARPEGAPGETAEAQEMLAELRGQLDSAMEKLEPTVRELIIQRYFVGRSQAELAAEAGVAPSTIAHRLEFAVEKLRRHLKAMGHGSLMAMGIGAVVMALEAEKAMACVPATLTANVMKIGLSGIGTAGKGLHVPIGTKALAIGVLATIAAVVIWLLWNMNWRTQPESRAPRIVPAALMPITSQEMSSTDSPAMPTHPAPNSPPVNIELHVYSAEGVELTDARPRLLDESKTEMTSTISKSGGTLFTVHRGICTVIVDRMQGAPEVFKVEVGKKPLAAWDTEQVVVVLH
jgi:RNA polymerase sigma factor (sigma-70 family)